jgi:serine/threonine protein kinase
MEYLEHGDLGRFLDKPFREKEAKDITFQLVQGLNHMHENKFVHRDLKPQVSGTESIHGYSHASSISGFNACLRISLSPNLVHDGG